eukprot:235600_1
MSSGTSIFYVMFVFGLLTVQSLFNPNRASDLRLLELESHVTSKDIKKRYKKLALKYHPDKNKEADAQETFVKIKDAFNRLSGKEPYGPGTATEQSEHDADRYMCPDHSTNQYIYIIMYFDAHNEGESYHVGDHSLFEMAAKTEKKRVMAHWHQWLFWQFEKLPNPGLFCVEMVPFVTVNTFMEQWKMMEYHNGYIVGMTIFNDAMVGEQHVGMEFKNNLERYEDNLILSRWNILNGIHNVWHDRRLKVKDLHTQYEIHLYMHGCNTGVYTKERKPQAVFKCMGEHGFRNNRDWMVNEGEQGYTYFSLKKDQYEAVDPKAIGGDVDVFLRAYNFKGSKNWGRFYTPRSVFKMNEVITKLN